jgi:hypothetical protein
MLILPKNCAYLLCCCYVLQEIRKIRKYDFRVEFRGMTIIPVFMKINQMFQTSGWVHAIVDSMMIS